MRSSNHWLTVPAQESWPRPVKLPKSSDDYLGALKRGWWFILLLTAIAGGVGTWFTLQQQPIYFASSRILIEPPRAIVPELGGEKTNAALSSNFFNTRVQMIASREITHRVLTSRALSEWKERTGIEDPFETLSDWVEVKPVLNSNLVDVMLEGTDPVLTAQIVNLVVEEFMGYEENSLREFEQLSRSKLTSEVRNLRNELDNKQKELANFHKEHNNFLSTGQSVAEARLEELEKAKTLAELHVDETRRAVERFEALQKADVPFYSFETTQRVETVQARIREIESELTAQKESIKPEWYETDPMIKRLKSRRDELVRSLTSVGKGDAEIELARLKQEHQFAAMDLDKINAQYEQQRQLVMGQQEEKERLGTIQSDHSRLTSLSDRMSLNELEVELHQSLVTPRIQVIDKAETPTVPIRPIKELQIPLCFAGGAVLAGMILITREMLNQRVWRPEQASLCLGTPVIGVIPRLKGRERRSWGGTLRLASEQPGSRVCEAFRTLRTGLLGAEMDERIRSLVVSSPTLAEGKTTVAANLAATCARAGESVLLVDMDLRRPRLARSLGLKNTSPGLVEAVAGNVSWHQAVQQTTVPNLFVLPAGETAGVPLDILGTVEMHDLLVELTDEFDRVILEGPSLLGLADARVVSRFADGVLLVVKANQHRASVLGRVREICDHDGLRLVGQVFNAIRYKADDWRPLPGLRTRVVERSLPGSASRLPSDLLPMESGASESPAA